MTCGIYKITNTKNNKVYIGQSTNLIQRLREHKSSLKGGYSRSNKLQNSFNKYGLESFKFETITKCCMGLLDTLEIYYIKKYNSIKCGYNLESGGNKNKTMSVESRLKISKAKLGKKRGPAWNIGIPNSNEQKIKISLALKGRPWNKNVKESVCKSVIDIVNGYVWESAFEASQIYKFDHSYLTKMLNNKRPNYTNLRYVDSI